MNIRVTEVMSDDLGVERPHPNPFPREYTLDNFKRSLMPYFYNIEYTIYPLGVSKKIFMISMGGL